MNTTTKRNMHNPAAFIGKRIDITKWNIIDPYGEYAICTWTGKLMRADSGDSFDNYPFNSDWLKQHNVYVEAAEYLSVEGYEQLVDIVNNLLAEYGCDYSDISSGDVYIEEVCCKEYYEINEPYTLARALARAA